MNKTFAGMMAGMVAVVGFVVTLATLLALIVQMISRCTRLAPFIESNDKTGKSG